ncbi:MAG: adenylate kinase family protein [Candidatus Bathyarchaeota archaeon]|nr:adenylate kinase family protein [Candidatus Bathyarchaeota archaeon]
MVNLTLFAFHEGTALNIIKHTKHQTERTSITPEITKNNKNAQKRTNLFLLTNSHPNRQNQKYPPNPKEPMNKRVILITGTPATGKTTLAKKLAVHLNAQYINLTELTEQENLALEEDKERETVVVDEAKMRRKLRTLITKTQKDTVIDGHYAAAVTPTTLTTHVFVLRRSPAQLRQFMQQRGYSQAKLQENLEAEILDVCLVEALQKQDKTRVCELDTTNKTPEEILREVLTVLNGKKPCFSGFVDWLGLLEREGKIDEYLKP